MVEAAGSSAAGQSMTSVPRFSSAEVVLESLLQIAEQSLTVVHLAELDLQRADGSWPADRTLRWMQQNGFDAAPIDEPEAHQFVGVRLPARHRGVRRPGRRNTS